MNGQSRPAAWVHCDSDAAHRDVQTDQRQIFASVQMTQVIDQSVDRLAGVLDAPQAAARPTADVLRYELLRKIVNLQCVLSKTVMYRRFESSIIRFRLVVMWWGGGHVLAYGYVMGQ